MLTAAKELAELVGSKDTSLTLVSLVCRTFELVTYNYIIYIHI